MNELLLALVVAFSVVCLAVPAARAEVTLPAIISDNMVLQADAPCPVWGWAAPGEKVTVAIAGQSKTAAAGSDGRWQIALDPIPAGGPLEMMVTGPDNALAVSNILVGEVWLAGGQSNMQMRMREVTNAKEEVAAAGYPRIRLFTVPHIVSQTPERDVLGEWVECSPESIPGFPAVAYFFGRKIHEDLGTPVGLVNDCWSGSLCEAWISRATLDGLPGLKPLLDAWQVAVTKRTDKEKAAYDELQSELAAWREAWPKAARGHKPPCPDADRQPFDPLSNFQQPSGLYGGMIAPVIPYRLRGVIWYQGEGNSERAYQYRTIFPALIRDWRKNWGQGDFPFLFVQISSYREAPEMPRPSEWGELREAQLMTLAVPNTAMAVSLDVGDAQNAHYKNKQAVGARLALAAEGTVYGKAVVYAGPVYDAMKVEGGKVRLSFRDIDGGLVAKGSDDLKTFQIAGADREWRWADARIDGDGVVVSTSEVPAPAAVRYGWMDNALAANLYNKAGLPASSFRTDDWPESTQDAVIWSGLDDWR